MTNKNVKQRDVMTFEEFRESYDQARKVVMLPANKDAHPGAHKIEGVDLYVRNDANPYKAFGIPHNEKIEDASRYSNANQVDIYDNAAPGKDQKDVFAGKKQGNIPDSPAEAKERKKGAIEAGTVIANMNSLASLEESKKEEPKEEPKKD